MTDRTEHLVDLERSIASQDWRGARESLFRVLYGVPIERVTGLCRGALERYALADGGVFVEHTRELLADPRGWVVRHGRGVPDDEPSGAKEAAYLFAIDALLLAIAHGARDDIAASAASVALENAIEAEAIGAWERDDPEAAEMWRRVETEEASREGLLVAEALAGRNHLVNAAALEARKRAWQALLTDLRTSAIADAPDAVDPARLEADLQRWREHEYLLVTRGE